MFKVAKTTETKLRNTNRASNARAPICSSYNLFMRIINDLVVLVTESTNHELVLIANSAGIESSPFEFNDEVLVMHMHISIRIVFIVRKRDTSCTNAQTHKS